MVVNGKPGEEYFPRVGDIATLLEPLQVTGTEKEYNVVVKVRGGGVSGQVGAIRHGIARALLKADIGLTSDLRRGGFLTRDSRVKERKKPGLKRARKAPQYTKR
jgi:small subunit ribosomal protein S9